MLPAVPLYTIPGQTRPGLRAVRAPAKHLRTQSQESQASASSVSTCGSQAEVLARPAPEPGRCRVRACGRHMLKASAGKDSKDPDARTFRTWEVELPGLERDLEPQGWNRQYQQSQQIFATPQGQHTRQLLQAEGRQLFKQAPVVADAVLSGKELLAQLLAASDDGTHVLVYALCIKQNRAVLRFCKARTLVAHAAMAEGRDSVWCSGELVVADGTVILDNNSGTYAPPAAQLQRIPELLRRCWPDLAVEAMHFEDPRLAALKAPLFGDPYSTFSGGRSQTALGLKRNDQVEVQQAGRWLPDSVQCIASSGLVLGARSGWVDASQVRRPSPGAVQRLGYPGR